MDYESCRLFEAQASEAQSSDASKIHIRPRGVSAETLSNIWKIDHEAAKRTLDATTHLSRHGPNISLSRNLGTN